MDNINPGTQGNPQNNTAKQGISHSPLDLGGSRPIEVQKAAKPQPQAQPQPQKTAPATAPASVQVAPTCRICAVKTFFTKLHPGALDFFDEQVNNWLKENPSVNIKLIQTAVGEVQGKKTEPNIIITIWY